MNPRLAAAGMAVAYVNMVNGKPDEFCLRDEVWQLPDGEYLLCPASFDGESLPFEALRQATAAACLLCEAAGKVAYPPEFDLAVRAAMLSLQAANGPTKLRRVTDAQRAHNGDAGTAEGTLASNAPNEQEGGAA